MKQQKLKSDSSGFKNLSVLSVWALSFGCIIGWGSVVVPGTTFLPAAGPLGTILGLSIGAAVMLIIAVNYTRLMHRYPSTGGTYTYAAKLIGGDHGFLCGWMLILTYTAITWTNAAALPLIMRYLLGNVFCFGFSYEIAGYTVYFGEVLISACAVAITCLICVLSRRLTKWLQGICSLLLFIGIAVIFIAVVIHRGGLSLPEPLFSSKDNHAEQVFGIVILCSWAFIGFESVSHSSDRFNFSKKRILPVLVTAIIAGFLAYVMLTLSSAAAQPEGFSNWDEYTGSLSQLKGIQSVPIFFNAHAALGSTGLIILAVTAFCGIISSLIGNSIAVSNLMQSMSTDGMLPRRLEYQNKQGTAYVAMIFVAVTTCLIPLLGRTAIGWIVNVTSVSAAVVYTYVSVCAYIIGKAERNLKACICGIIGTIITGTFAILCLIPNIISLISFDTKSYLILVIWCVLGMVVFRLLISKDKTRRFGKSEIVWIILFFIIVMISLSWIYQMSARESQSISEDIQAVHMSQAEHAGLEPDTEEVREMNEYISDSVYRLNTLTVRNVVIYSILMMFTVFIIFSIFSIIKKREHDIEAERLRAEETSRAKTVFLSNMSHDIRTPMNAITGYTSLALNSDNLPENIRSYLEKIDYSGKHLLALINDILDMSRIESGKVELDLAPVDLNVMLDEVSNFFALQFAEKKLRYVLECDIADRYIICDKPRLERVLINLISNAYKFTPSGGCVTVTLRQVGVKNGRGRYKLTVADTGIGMGDEFQKYLFNAFERERTSTVTKEQGTGLGMAITKNLLELMGGTISVESEKDKGTTFTVNVKFDLTRREVYEITQEKVDIPDREEIKDKHLLIAEDNPINFEIASEVLTQMGFTVDGVENGREAVEKIKEMPPEYYCLLLMDIQMPVMNGYEATRSIRAIDDERAQIPIIALTANSFEKDRQDAFNAGMNSFVSKPFDLNELEQTIIRYMR